MKLKIKVVLAFTFLLRFAFSQVNHNIDSLQLQYKNAGSDTAKLRYKIELSLYWRFINPDTAITLAEETLNESKKYDYEYVIGKSVYAIGMANHMKGNYDEAIKYYEEAIPMFERMQRKTDVAKIYLNMGLSYSSKSQHSKALELYYIALKLLEETGDKKVEAVVLGNIGVIHYYNQEFQKAINFAEKALVLDKAVNNTAGVARHLGNIGSIYLDLGAALRTQKKDKEADEKVKKGLEKLLLAQELYEQQQNKPGLALNIGNIANAYNDLGDTAKSMAYYQMAYKLDEELGNKVGMSRHLGNIGWIYYGQGKYEIAVQKFNEAIDLLKGIRDFNLLTKWHSNLSAAYEGIDDYKKALEHYKMSNVYRDSLINLENAKKNLETEMNFEFQKKENAAKEESARQAIIRNVFIAGFVVVLVMALLILRGYRIKRRSNKAISEQKELLEIKNKEITDSIHYAKRIQRAHLPNEDYISKKINDLKHKV